VWIEHVPVLGRKRNAHVMCSKYYIRKVIYKNRTSFYLALKITLSHDILEEIGVTINDHLNFSYNHNDLKSDWFLEKKENETNKYKIHKHGTGGILKIQLPQKVMGFNIKGEKNTFKVINKKIIISEA
jgi:hypothetical protein